MSVEAFVIAGLISEGSPKRAFTSGISESDFEIYDEEFRWLVRRAERKQPINARLFKKEFPDFDFLKPSEKMSDLLDELKQERAYLAISSGIDEVLTNLSAENAIENAQMLREILGDALRLHGSNSDVLVKAGWEDHYQRVKELSILRESGEIPGIPTGLPHLDFHWGGLQGQTSTLLLGRPGDAKSFTLAKFAVEGALAGYKVGFFSPEMTEHQHNCRFHTLLSAKRDIQDALKLHGAFRNRALKDGMGFNLKQYRRFLQWIEEHLPGEIALFTQKYRREKMSIGYIESRVQDLGLDLIIVDPIYKLKPLRHRGNRWEELQEITDALTDLAHTYNIPVVLSNQAARALVGKRGEAPDKDSSFGADAPAQEADTVIGVKHFSEERIMKYNCSKNRHGEGFKFTAKFHPNIGVLEDVTPLTGDYLNGYDPEKVAEAVEAIKEMDG